MRRSRAVHRNRRDLRGHGGRANPQLLAQLRIHARKDLLVPLQESAHILRPWPMRSPW